MNELFGFTLSKDEAERLTIEAAEYFLANPELLDMSVYNKQFSRSKKSQCVAGYILDRLIDAYPDCIGELLVKCEDRDITKAHMIAELLGMNSCNVFNTEEDVMLKLLDAYLANNQKFTLDYLFQNQ